MMEKEYVMLQLSKRKVGAKCSGVEVVGCHQKLQCDLRFDLELGNILLAVKHIPECRLQHYGEKKNKKNKIQRQAHSGKKTVSTNDVFCPMPA